MPTDRPADVVANILDEMDRHAERTKLAIFAAVAIEGLLVLFALWRIDWANDTQVLIFVLSVLGYTILALGLAALGAHVSRVGARVVAALGNGGRE